MGARLLTRLWRKLQRKELAGGGDAVESASARAKLSAITGAATEVGGVPLPAGAQFAAGPLARFQISRSKR